jgi:hypothetical protein
MPNFFHSNSLPSTRRRLSNRSLGIPPNVVSCLMQLEDARKRGWAAFFSEHEVQVNGWRRDGVRRATLTTVHRQVQSTTAGTHLAPVHFLKGILRGYEAMIAKWGPPSPELHAQIDTLEGHFVKLTAEVANPETVDPPAQATLDAVEAAIVAVKALKPEQEREECVICAEEIKDDEVFNKDQGVLFAPMCLHAMHDVCARRYFNSAKDHGVPAGANGLPNQGKGIACPAKCGAHYTHEYVVNMRKAKDQVIEDREKGARKAAQEAERTVKRKAEALDDGIDSEDDEDALVQMPEDNDGFVPLNQKPGLEDTVRIQNWLDRKVAAGHLCYSEANNAAGQTYQFVLDGTERTYPLNIFIKAAGYTRFSSANPKIDLGCTRKGKDIKGMGKLLAPTEPAAGGA